MKQRKMSILRRILLPLMAIMVLQTVLIFGWIVFGGVLPQMRANEFDLFEEKVSSRKNILSGELLQRWSSMGEIVARIRSDTQIILDKQPQKPSALEFQDELSLELLDYYAEDVLYLLRKNSVSGAFVILEGDDPLRKSGVYFSDSDPGSNPDNFSDLLARRAPSALTQELGIALDADWLPYFDFEGVPEQERAFYDKPMHAAQKVLSPNGELPGYWSASPFFNKRGVASITYSVPLCAANGLPYGVLGVELELDYLKRFLPARELSENGGYLLAISDRAAQGNATQDFTVAAFSDGVAQSAAAPETVRLTADSGYDGVFLLRGTPPLQSDMYAIVNPIPLYRAHTPFENEEWSLIGLVGTDELLADVNRFRGLILLLWVVALALGAGGIILIARLITRPIGQLVQKLRASSSAAIISLERVNISEIDELLDSLESLSVQVADSASRLSKILELAGISIGAFEYHPAKSNRVFCTKDFFTLLDVCALAPEDGSITRKELQFYLNNLDDRLDGETGDGSAQVYRMGSEEEPRWISVKCVSNQAGILGVVADVTQEMMSRRRIEHDRDYDSLTGLYNRRAFHQHTDVLFASPETLQTAAMVMLDLDNLKFINDTYGHDYGDEYIRLAADVLRKYTGGSVLLSRLSGDEFALLLYGRDGRDEIYAACKELQNGMRLTSIYLPDHTKMQVRASAGIAWYPVDSVHVDDLLRYADFAMYMVKKTRKGEFTDFDLNSYNEESYLLHCREELNTILDQQLVDFQFQPIMNARTGELFAFEALMRPQTANIKTPLELLSLARSQSKLAQIERLTFFRALERFTEQPIAQGSCLLFINSVANQVMSVADVELLEQRYAAYLGRIVVELTEEERPEKNFTGRKEAYTKKWGAGIALDDFGVGYNGEAMLLNIVPDYIKIDNSIVQNIHADANRMQLVKNILSYCGERGIKVIAEGVETRADLATLIRAGVDYLQGYYLGKPTYAPNLDMAECGAEILEICRESAQAAKSDELFDLE